MLMGPFHSPDCPSSGPLCCDPAIHMDNAPASSGSEWQKNNVTPVTPRQRYHPVRSGKASINRTHCMGKA